MKKRMMAMLMTAILVIASIPFTAFADEMPAEVLGGEAMEAAAAAEAMETEEMPARETEVLAETEKVEAEVTETSLDGIGETNWALLKNAMKGEDQVSVPGAFDVSDDGGTGIRTITLLTDITAGTIEGSLMVTTKKNVILDLNGRTLDRGLAGESAQSDGGSVISVNIGASFTLRDSLGSGIVTGGNNVGGGGGVRVYAGATFTMEGGMISGNKAKNPGAGVFVVDDPGAAFIMKGGRITENESYYNPEIGAGIHFEKKVSTGGKMYVGGDAVVEDNYWVKNGVKTTRNAWLADKLTIGTGENGVPKPTKNMSIGVAFTSAPQPGQEVQFTENASSGDEQYFIPDNGELKVAYNSAGYLTLQYPTLSIKSDKSTYNVGEKITLTFKTFFVDAGTEIIVTDGTGTMKVSVKEDGTAEFPVNAVKAGSITYTAAIADPKLEAATTVTVIDVPKTYHTVKFNTFGGTPVPETQAVLENGKAARPQKDPAKDGYEFAGWYADEGCTNPYKFNEPVTSDITIFAKWTKKPGPKPDPTPSSDDTSEPLFTGNLNNPVKNGKWTQDANGVWNYTSSEVFRNTWGYIANPYAQEGQHQADWFYFDQYGHMLTGWQLINGKWYYLNPTKDGTLGACFIGPGKTPDGWEIDETGAWTGR